MKRIPFLLFFFYCSCPWVAVSQTYVGEVLVGTSYQYAKLVKTDSVTTFTFPYLDNKKKHVISGAGIADGNWTIQRDFETWTFDTEITSSGIQGTLLLNGTTQNLQLYEQKGPLAETMLTKYEGVFEDEAGNRSLIYATNGYLHLISPYSERSMSLKPIGENRFWSVSGEQTTFIGDTSSNFTQIKITNRFGSSLKLTKRPPIAIEETFVTVGQDSLFAKIFIPSEKGKVPACLVLPGGGATGMSNYEYEARYFAAHGMLALVFDKPGNGKSKGPGNFQTQTFEEKTQQYLQILKFVKQHPKVDATKVGVHGPSEGGRLALMMAIDDPEIAFVNATAAPLMTMREGQLYAIDHYLRGRGIDEVDNVAIRSVWNDYYQGIIDENISAQIIARANVFRNKYERLFIPPNSQNIPVSPNASDLQNDRVVAEAGKIQCPIFIQYGENDERVHPEKSLQNFFKQLDKDVPVTVKLYPRANHSFMTPEYEISHGYTHDKLEWLQQIGILTN